MQLLLFKLKQNKPQNQGFTLIELLIVILIIGILAAIAIPIFNGQRNKARDAQAKSSVRNALSAARAYYTDKQAYVLGSTTANTDGEGEMAAGNYTTLANDLKDTESSLNFAFGTAQSVPSGGPPENIKGTVRTNTTGGQYIILCSASTSGSSYCIKDVQGGTGQGVTYKKIDSAQILTSNFASSGFTSSW